MSVTTAGTILSYNGVSFGPYTETTSFSCKPVPDRANRTISHNEYSATFRSYLVGPTANILASQLRAALSKNGGPLLITGRAFGNTDVNFNIKRDVTNGPWPKEISFRQIGGQACEVTFSLSWAMPECADARFTGKPMQFSFTVQTQIDYAGYTTRTIDLFVKIPQNREKPGSRTPQDSADLYLEQLTPSPLKNFIRTFGSRSLSEDRSEMTWSVIDTELAGPAPPKGVVKEEASISYSTDSMAAAVWKADLKYSCEVAKNGSLNDAIDGMQSFIKDRQERLKKIAGITPGGDSGGSGGSGQAPNKTVVPLNYRIVEPECLGRKKFEFTVGMQVTTTIAQILARSGMWSATPNRGRWKEWADSLKLSAFHPRGSAGLVFSPGMDKIIDLCGFGALPGERQGESGETLLSAGVFRPVTQEASWLRYRNSIYREQDAGVTATRTLPAKELDETTDRTGGTADDTSGGSGNPFSSLGQVVGGGVGGGSLGGGLLSGIAFGGVSEAGTLVGQSSAFRTARPQQFVIMKGEALRVGFEVPEPVLLEVYGLELLPANRLDKKEGFRGMVVGATADGQMIHYARWKLRYAVDGDLPSGPLPAAPNPMTDGAGGGTRPAATTLPQQMQRPRPRPGPVNEFDLP